MPFTYEFIDNGKSLGINFNGQGYTAGKNLVELTIPNLSDNNILKIRSNSATPTEFQVNIGVDTITGVGAGSATATDLRDALEAIFFLDEGGSGGSVDWGNIEGDINNQTDLPFTQTQSLVTFDRDVQFPNQSVFLGGGKTLGSTNELLVSTNVKSGEFSYLPEVSVDPLTKLTGDLLYVNAYDSFDKNSPQGQAQPSQTTTIQSQSFIEDVTGIQKHYTSVVIPSALGNVITYNWYLRSSTGFSNGYIKAYKEINTDPNSTDDVWSTATINDIKTFTGEPATPENKLINESASVNADIQIPLLKDGFFQKNGETLTFQLICDNAFELEAGLLPDGQGGTFVYPYIVVDGVNWEYSSASSKIIENNTPPTDTSKLWYNTNDNMIYFNDGADWLSEQLFEILFNEQGSTPNNTWFRSGNTTGNDLGNGYNMGFDAKIQELSFNRQPSTAQAGTFWLYSNQFTGTNNASVVTTFSVGTASRGILQPNTPTTIDNGKYISMRWSGNQTNNNVCVLKVRKKYV
tara:strand:+ start:237 stop:1793 length:1557 start_codon:yes stop_codon:yes gene_type:complete